MKVLSGMFCAEIQLQHEVISSCRHALIRGSDRRNRINTSFEWQTLRDDYKKTILNAFPDILFDRNKPLNSRVVSCHEFEDCNIENVIFESLPGWEEIGRASCRERV